MDDHTMVAGEGMAEGTAGEEAIEDTMAAGVVEDTMAAGVEEATVVGDTGVDMTLSSLGVTLLHRKPLTFILSPFWAILIFDLKYR